MFQIKKYEMVKELEEAWELNQSRANVILGGLMWLKMGNKNIQKAIDLSALGLDKIVEEEEHISIGCMTTLRTVEKSPLLSEYFSGAVVQSVKNIVGAQFRNGATVGGTIFGRYGFSDLLTCLLVLDTEVELYKKGMVSLREFVKMKPDNDILVRVLIKKDDRQVRFYDKRNSATDFSVLNCAVSFYKGIYAISIGARPGRAAVVIDEDKMLNAQCSKEDAASFLELHQDIFTFGSNMRGSDIYRKQLAKVFISRGLKETSWR